MGSDRIAKDLRAPNAHQMSGGIAFVQRSPGAITDFFASGNQDMATEVGDVLNVAAHQSAPNGTPAGEIQLTGGLFIGRAAIPRAQYPDVRYYPLARGCEFRDTNSDGDHIPGITTTRPMGPRITTHSDVHVYAMIVGRCIY